MWNNLLAAFKRESGGAAYKTNSGDSLRFAGAELGGMVMEPLCKASEFDDSAALRENEAAIPHWAIPLLHNYTIAQFHVTCLAPTNIHFPAPAIPRLNQSD